tara:strand:+ start:352 stop:1188 length:837 start_codon:yes stop_codon:yes gene_type:complete
MGIENLFSGGLQALAAKEMFDSAISDVGNIGTQAVATSQELGEQVANMTEFKPFTIATGLGGATTDAQGGFALQMSPEQQALQNQLMSGAQSLFGQVGVDPSTAQADLYEQIRATQRPEEQRKALALEERMLSQGRLGLSSDAYGGATPEMLAQQTAVQEAMGRANLGAREQAMAEQKQALDAATGMMNQGYKPQEEALAALGYGVDLAKLPLTGQTAGAEMFGQLGQTGLESQIGAQKIIGEMRQAQIKGMFDSLFAPAGTEGGFNLGDELVDAIFN